MISKTEISGWLGRVSLQTGWSDKIAKRKWIVLNLFSLLAALTVLLFILDLVTPFNVWTTSGTGYFIIIFFVLFGHKDWDRDQEKIRDKEEMVTL